MGEKTGISWTNKTWNPWQGCIKVSAGCKNCYMYRDMARYGKDPRQVRRSSDTTFYAPLKWRDPALVFTCSWSDFFIEQADAWRGDAWKVIEMTPWLTYQILTKRPHRILQCLIDHSPWALYGNVWLGTSIENDEYRFPRLHDLLSIMTPVHFISAEPLLGPLNLRWELGGGDIEWVIVGGESGPNARPMELDWARRIRDDCAEFGVPFFLKQIGGNRKVDGTWGGDMLDGYRYHEFPDVASLPHRLG